MFRLDEITLFPKKILMCKSAEISFRNFNDRSLISSFKYKENLKVYMFNDGFVHHTYSNGNSLSNNKNKEKKCGKIGKCPLIIYFVIMFHA